MPFAASDASDDLQLKPQSPTSAALTPQAMQDTSVSGSGADGPKYSALDFWAAQMRATSWGQGTSNLMLKSAYNAPLIPNADDPALADGKVPDGMEQYASEFVGLHTPEEVAYKTAQIKQKLADQRILASNGFTGAIQFPLQALDPTNIALAATPLAETRLANSIRQAIAAAAAGGAQEVLQHQLDPTHAYGLESLENIGSSAILGGVLGAALRPKVPKEEYERMRAHLEEMLRAKVDESFGGPGGPGDTAEQIARDLKARLAEHGEALERAAGEHAGAAEGLDPKEVAARVQDAQERLREAQGAVDPDARAEAIAREVERLQTPETVKQRLLEQHGERLPEVLEARAAENVDAGNEQARMAAEKAQADLDDALADQARLERAAASKAELERFRGIEPPPQESVPTGETHAAPPEPGLRPDVSAHESAVEPGRGQPAEPVSGADVERTARGPEGIPGRAGQPLAVRPASVRGTPLEGLGNIFEADTGEGAGQGARLALQRPLELRSDEVPKFDTVKQARAWATEQIARGHDGLVIDSSHLGGPTHYVSFHPDQVNHPSIDRYAGMISSAPRVEAQVYNQLKEMGRFDDKQIRAYAAIVGDFYGTQAKRLGITGDELFQRFPLNVTQGEAAAGFAQASRGPFYSAAIRAVEGLTTARATGEQWIKTLDNLAAKGVKPEELEWMGVKEWLAKREGPVSRADLLAYMNDHQVRLQDVIHSDAPAARWTDEENSRAKEINDRMIDAGYRIVEVDDRPELYTPEGPIESPGALSPALRDAWNEYMALHDRGTVPTQFGQYALPGGQSYKEHLLTLAPLSNGEEMARLQSHYVEVKGAWSEAIAREAIERDLFYQSLGGGDNVAATDRANMPHWVDEIVRDKDDVFGGHTKLLRAINRYVEDPTARAHAVDQLDRWVAEKRTAIKLAEATSYAQKEMKAAKGEGFTAGHWREPNVIAHVRTNARIDAEGREVLHIEEIQSDWHQKGRLHGYEPKPARATELQQRRSEIEARGRDATPEEKREWAAIMNELQPDSRSRVPDAPFKKSWPELALKKMIVHAAENGFDRITWTTGAQQAERYNLARHFSDIMANTRDDGRVHVYAHDKSGTTVYSEALKPEEVEGLVGKEIAQKLLDGLTPEEGVRKLSGLDLKVGGEGMKAFYDSMLPKIAGKLAKRFGGKVGESSVQIAPGLEDVNRLSREEREEYNALIGADDGHPADLTDQEMERLTELQEKAIKPAQLEKVHALDIPPEMAAAAREGQPLFQGNRGTYDPVEREIALLPTADVSTFLHEAGHHFLDVMGQLAAQHDAPLSIREDFDHLMKWFGIHDPLMGAEAWTQRSIDEQRPYHEQFARAFEEYLQEGRAPSPRLQTIFEKFRTWLTECYKSLSVFNEHTPEVRGVMDRMLADETEIRAARQERIEAATTPATKRLAADDELRDSLRNMAERETGWAQKGGEMIRREINGGRGNEFEISRTSWIPNSEWWAERPGSYSPEEVSNIVEKALAGQNLGKTQQRLLEHMIEAHDQRIASEPYLPQAQELTQHGLDPGNPEHEANVAMTARLRAIDEDLVEQLATRHGDDDAGFMDAVRSALHANDEDAKIGRSIPQRIEPPAVDSGRGSAAGSERAAESGERFNQAAREPDERVRASADERPDLFGDRTAARQRLADETRRRDLARNSGQESLETGDSGDLFSAARRQGDLFAQSARPLRDNLREQLARLPPAERAKFEARIEALEHPAPKRAPLYAAPEDSTAGAQQKDPRVAEMEANTYARGGRVLGRLTGWFAPGSRALRSPFLTMRRASQRLLETPEVLAKNVPTRQFPHGIPTEQSVEAKLKRWEGSWATAWSLRDQLYRQYRNRPLSDIERNQGRMDKHAFNEAVSAAMRRGDIHETPEVEKAAQMTRKVVFDPLKVEAQKLGLLGPDEGLLKGTASSYLMRQYDRSKINANPREWHDILVQHFMQNDGLEAAEASDVAHRVTMNIKGSELGLLDSDAKVFDQVADSGRVKERQLLMPDEKLEKFLVNDIDTLSHSYLHSLAPQVEIMKAFPGDDRNLKQVALDLTDEFKILKQRALVDNDTRTADLLDQRLNRDLRDLAAMRDRLYGMFGAPADPSHWAVRAGRAIRSMNGFRMLGTATFSHIPDLANVVMRRGLQNTFATAARLLSNFEALNLSREQIHRVGAATDMIHNSTAATLGEFGIESSYAYQKALNRGMRAFTIATLETPLIASTKMLSGAAAHDEILEAAERVAKGRSMGTAEKIRFNNMGLGYSELQRAGEMFKQYGRSVNGLRFGMTDLWHDRGAAELVDGATAMAADAATLHPSAGDTPLWTSSEIGKAIFQFKSFGAVAIRKILIPLAQGLARGDARAFQGLATLIGAGTLTYLAKQALSGQPVEKNPARFALEVLDKSNLLGWTGEYFYPALWAMGANNFSRWGDRQTWETLGGPVAGTAADVWDLRLPAKIKGQLMHDADSKQRFSRGDLHRIRRLLPANQVWYLRRGVNALEGKIGDSMGLPPEAPRGSTE